jgi:hypothetical protein
MPVDEPIAARPDSARRVEIMVRAALAVMCLALAAGLVVLDPLHGPIVFSLVSEHGLDAGDFVALPLVLVATYLVRDLVRHGRVGQVLRMLTDRHWVGSSALVLGLLLLVAQGARLLDLDDRIGVLPYLLVLALAVSVVWFVVDLVLHPPTGRGGFRGRAWVVGALLLSGLLMDALLTPSGTLMGAILVSGYAAVVVRASVTRVVFAVMAIAFTLLTVASLTDIGGIDVAMAKDQGGGARSAALGLLLVVVGIAGLAESHDRASTSEPVGVLSGLQ